MNAKFNTKSRQTFRIHQRNKSGIILAGIIFFFAVNGLAQYTHKGCPDLKNSDFNSVELFTKKGNGIRDVSLAEPVAMDLNPIYDGNTLSHVDVYFVDLNN